MNPGVELLKEMDPEKVMAWDRLHDTRKVFRCERCGAEWKCEYGANTFGTVCEYNGDPDILCQCCGFPTVKEVGEYTDMKEVLMREMPEREYRTCNVHDVPWK